MNDIQNLFKEMKPEYIRTSLKRMWLEEFHAFCEEAVIIIFVLTTIDKFNL
jgi:V-type H+-transporting ATPase subunit d